MSLQVALQTPIMQQYLSIKKGYPNEVLFFRMGDFYEMFLEDAVYASRILEIALTRKSEEIPMCGIPYHSWQNYVLKIIQSGKNVAICEQTEDPKEAKNKILRREVVRILTPGSVFEEELLEQTSHSLLGSLYFIEQHRVSVAIADLSTGEIKLDMIDRDEIKNFIITTEINEILYTGELPQELDIPGLACQKRDYNLTPKSIEQILTKHFDMSHMGLLELSSAEQHNLAHLFNYLEEIANRLSIKWQKPVKEYQKKKMILDDIALQTLEILKDHEQTERASLFGILNHTKTSGGKRLLKETLMAPSLDLKNIQDRHDVVSFFIQNSNIKNQIETSLKKIKDILRLTNHLNYSPQVHHLGSLVQSLQSIKEIISILKGKEAILPYLLKTDWLKAEFPQKLLSILKETLFMEKLPPLLDERRFVKQGFSQELDNVFFLSESTHKILAEFEEKERKKWGISSLKVRYNKLIGYYIEISKSLVQRAPDHYLRRQTLINGERFKTSKLDELESKILNAKESIIEKQKAIFLRLVEEILTDTDSLRNWAYIVSYLDVLISFAQSAILNRYNRPEINTHGLFSLKQSRHPVVENLFKQESFVPNDAELDLEDRHLAILTGPNMSGKSTYIRQIGLIQIMAQAGSFVPASQANLPLVDRIFTRIGAYDRLSKGESTFYVEMSECAKIFQHYTKNSLILLDEVGRGTSTFDGVSIARAMLEFLNSQKKKKAKILFATHFTELSEMINPKKGIFGLTVQVLEEGGKVIFLRKIIEGAASKSHGIYVARLAGMPHEIIQRAMGLISSLEQNSFWEAMSTKLKNTSDRPTTHKKDHAKKP